MRNSKKLKRRWKSLFTGAKITLGVVTATAAELSLQLTGSSITRNKVDFKCSAEGVKLGLPAKPFPVEYINGGGNSLAILPISGHALIFVSVMTGSGARYASDRFIWWDAGARGAHLFSDSLDGKKEVSCQQVGTR